MAPTFGLPLVFLEYGNSVKLIFALVYLASLPAVVGCGSTKTERTQFQFTFQYDGAEYLIISVVVSSDGGHNFLTRREDGELVFSAKDEDQNGVLDTILVGNMSLASANHIYARGIELARNQGRYREIPGTRIFEYRMLGSVYVVQSLTPDVGQFLNRFTYFNSYRTEIICMDDDADGVLDRIQHGLADLEVSQELYETVLKVGVQRGLIRAVDNRYVVQPR